MRNSSAFLVLCLVVGAGCGSDKNLSVSYSVSGSNSPNLIVMVSADRETASKTDSEVAGSTTQFNTPLNQLKACSVYLGWLSTSTSIGTFAADRAICNDLAAEYKNLLSQISAPTPPYNPDRLNLQNKESGYLFVISFFQIGTTNACMHLAAREIQGGDFLDASAGSRSTQFAYTMSGDFLGTSESDRTKCIPIP